MRSRKSLAALRAYLCGRIGKREALRVCGEDGGRRRNGPSRSRGDAGSGPEQSPKAGGTSGGEFD